MNNKSNRPGQAGQQSKPARTILKKKAAPSPEDIETLSPEEMRRRLYDLGDYRIELEEWNEALCRSQAELGKRIMALEQAESCLKKAEKALQASERKFREKQAEIFLKNSEERFRVLLKNVVLGIFIIKRDTVIYLDPEQEILCGPLFSSFITTYFDSKDAEKIESFYKEILASGNSKEGLELRFSPRGNAWDNENMRWVHCKGSRIEHEGAAAVMIALVDVTKVKEMEKVMQLREKMASLGQVATGIAHEIRNPLSGINIFLEGIAENFEYPENAEDIRMLIKEAQKASGKIEATIKRVLDFARPSRPHMKETDINIPVREAIGLLGATLRKRDIFIESDLGESLPSLFLDSLLIEQVVMNLITNAADAMKNNKRPKHLRLTTSRVQNDVFLSISDSGEGVPAAFEKKIFDPFFTTKADGSGIGLSFCQRVITDHNGTISLLPSEWGGAQFRIKLPVDKRVLSR